MDVIILLYTIGTESMDEDAAHMRSHADVGSFLKNHIQVLIPYKICIHIE